MLARDVKGKKMICYCFSKSKSMNKGNVGPWLRTGAGNLVTTEVDGSGELNPLASAPTSKVSCVCLIHGLRCAGSESTLFKQASPLYMLYMPGSVLPTVIYGTLPSPCKHHVVLSRRSCSHHHSFSFPAATSLSTYCYLFLPRLSAP